MQPYVENQAGKRPPPRSVRRAVRELGTHVVTWRKLRGLTQAQLAERANVARGTLVRLERGNGQVSAENLLRVLSALGVIDNAMRAIDPYESDLGRLRSDEQLPRRVRTKALVSDD